MLEFSSLIAASRSGFGLIGSCSAVVTTPRLYRPGSRHEVTVSSRAGTQRKALEADGRGRLRVSLELGPVNRFQEYTPQVRASPSRFFRTVVSVR